MPPSAFPLNLYRGDTFRVQFQTWSDAGKTQPADLTGVEAKAEIREQPSGVVIVPIDCTITLPNIIDLLLTATNARLVPARGVWDLQLTYPGGDVLTIVAGPVTQTLDVTDSTLPAVRGLSAVGLVVPRLRLVSGF